MILELGILLRRLLFLGSPEPRYAAEQGLEDIGGPPRLRVAAFGVIAGDQIAGPPAGARLQVGEIGFHARDLCVDFATLRGRIRTEHEELAIAAAERTGVGPGAPELGTLAFDRRLRAARPAMSGDSLLQAGALGVLRQRNVGAESDDLKQ